MRVIFKRDGILKAGMKSRSALERNAASINFTSWNHFQHGGMSVISFIRKQERCMI